MNEIGRLRGLLPQTRRADAAWAAPRLDTAAARLARGQSAERLLVEIAARLEASAEQVAERGRTPLTLDYPEQLPVAARRDEILTSLRQQNLLVLTGETGSGKTTQLPKMLLELGYGRRGLIAVTQPRRVAAIAIAERLADELHATDGVIAHSVRFDDRAGPKTLIRVMTDGLLLAEASGDPDFSAYDAILVDEAHERSLNIDLLLGLLKRARERRPDLTLVIASASIAAERFAAFFGETGLNRQDAKASNGPGKDHEDSQADLPVATAPIIQVSGRVFPVEIRHQPPGDDDVGYLDATLRAVREIHDDPRSGDILVFLPTERDILEARRRLDELPAATILPLFSRLNPTEQRRVFLPARGRKIILATNIAETSLTLPGITTVVDAGLVRQKRFQAASRTERLPVEPISRASATQRAGRAGRIAPGVCIRLYAEDDLARRDEFTTPEILRSNLAGVLLTCLHLGLGDPQVFPWLDPPSPHAWEQARGLLDELGALAQGSTGTERYTLSAMGRTLARIPADPQVARILIAGLTEGCPQEACSIAAFLSVQDPRVRPLGQEAKADAAHRGFAQPAGDLATILVLWDRWQAAVSASARRRLCQDLFLGERRMREWSDVRHQLWTAIREIPGNGSAPRNLAQPSRAGGEGFGEGWSPEARGKMAQPSRAGGAEPLPDQKPVHRCVLAGMLGNVLHWDPEQKAYRGAGDRLLTVHPGSALRAGDEPKNEKKSPPAPWIVACEVVETSRLFARLCAPIDPLWVELLAGDRVRRRHRDPHYHLQRRQVVVVETVLWKGLPIRDGRLVPYARIEPVAAADIFIREALCREDGVAGLAKELPVLAENRRIFLAAQRLRHRLRDGTLFIEEPSLAAAYAQRLTPDQQPEAPPSASASDSQLDPSRAGARRSQPAQPGAPHSMTQLGAPHSVRPELPATTGQPNPTQLKPSWRSALPGTHPTSAAELLAWVRHHGSGSLRITLADLVDPAIAATADQDYPELLVIGDLRLRLAWKHAPGAEDDGATLTITEDEVPRLDTLALDGAVPGWIPDQVLSWLEGAPKDLRRALIPLAESAKAIAGEVRAGLGRAAVTDLVADAVLRRTGQRFACDHADLPAWQRLRFKVTDDQGATVLISRERNQVLAQAAAAEDRLRPLRRIWDTVPHGAGRVDPASASGRGEAQLALDHTIPQAWPGDCPDGEVREGGVAGFVALARARAADGTVAARRTVYAHASAAAAWHADGLEAALEAALSQDLSGIAGAATGSALSTCNTVLGIAPGAARRQLALAAALEIEPGAVRSAEAFSRWLDKARPAAVHAGRVADQLLIDLTRVVAELKKRLGQGAKALAQAAIQRDLRDELDRLLGPGWAMRRPFSASQRLPAAVTALGKRLDLAGKDHVAAQRLHQRSQEWQGFIDDAEGAGDPRLIDVCSERRRWRALHGLHLACLAALGEGRNSGGGHASGGQAEAQLRGDSLALAKRLGLARERIANLRDRLLGAQTVAERLVAGGKSAAKRLLADANRHLASWPDLTLGADLDAQQAVIETVLYRISCLR